MPKFRINFCLFLLIALLNTSCREKISVSPSQISLNPAAQAEFNNFLKLTEQESGINDSLLQGAFNKTASMLSREEQLLLYRKMGEYFYNNELLDSAMVYFTKGLEIAKKTEYTYYTSVFHLMRGSAYTYLSEFDPALIELKTAYNLATTIDSFRLQARTSRNLGNVYWNIGNYDLALDFYFISLEISRKSNFKLEIASALNNIGNVYQEIGNYDRAIDYYKQSEALAETENFSRVIAISNNNLGDIFSLRGSYDSALVYFKEALGQLNIEESKYDAGIYIGNIAEVYFKTDSLDKSEQFFLESLGYAEETGDKTGIASCNLGLAEVYLKRKMYEHAFVFLSKGAGISEEIGSLKLMDRSYQLYSKYYLLKNEFPNSLHFLTKQMTVKDSIYSLENGQNVARLESQYKDVQNTKEIELLKQKQKNYRNLAIMGFSALVTISILIFIAYRQKTRSHLILSEKNHQIEVSKKILEEKNKQLLKSQEQLHIANKGKDDFLTIISHDLRSPLSSIRGFTELLLLSYDKFSDEQRKTFLNEVFNSIERISLLINNILFWVKSQTNGVHFSPLEFNLLKRTEENISIYRMMIAKKEIVLENNIPSDVRIIADNNVFDMILRNILSNALKFTPEKGKITIDCQQINGKTNLSVSDTGSGIPEDKLKIILERNEAYSTLGTSHEQGTGLGLGLVYQFIKQSGGNLHIDSEIGKGTVVSITFDPAS